jgi:hypothetical protein
MLKSKYRPHHNKLIENQKSFGPFDFGYEPKYKLLQMTYSFGSTQDQDSSGHNITLSAFGVFFRLCLPFKAVEDDKDQKTKKIGCVITEETFQLFFLAHEYFTVLPWKDYMRIAEDVVEEASFTAQDYDNTIVNGTATLTKNVYKHVGKNMFWNFVLPYYHNHRINIDFDQEVGKAKEHSWKGGTLSASFEIRSGTTLLQGLRKEIDSTGMILINYHSKESLHK